MTKEELAAKLYQMGYSHGSTRKPPMTNDEVVRVMKLLEDKDA